MTSESKDFINFRYAVPLKNITTNFYNNEKATRPKELVGLNGQSGFGMYGAGIIPDNMNGPFGLVNAHLPNNVDYPTGITLENPNSTRYNARDMNAPSYNQQSFKNVSGYTFDKPLGYPLNFN